MTRTDDVRAWCRTAEGQRFVTGRLVAMHAKQRRALKRLLREIYSDLTPTFCSTKRQP